MGDESPRSEDAPDAGAGTRPSLRVLFRSVEQLHDAWRCDLSQGAIFVPLHDPGDLEESAEVEVELHAGAVTLLLPGEVASVLPPDLARAGAEPGVSVRLVDPPSALRERLEAIVGPLPEPGEAQSERRAAKRHPARVVARLNSADASLAAHTRNLSRSGVMVSVEGAPPPPVGEPVSLSLVHPTTGQQLEVEATVVRHVEIGGSVPALAIAFTPQEAERVEVQRFVDTLGSYSHAQRLAGLSGRIDEWGLAGLIQSIAANPTGGTLTLCRGEEEGRIVFAQGRLLAARVGLVDGIKAISRLLGWTDGTFGFQTHIDAADQGDGTMPLEMALLEATRRLDEAARIGALPVEMAEPLCVDAHALEAAAAELGKLEESLVDMARSGFGAGTILDMCPEDDHLVLAALLDLLERGVLRGGD